MREAMTGQLRIAMSNAQASARQLKQDFVSSEHLALGILATESSQAVKALLKDEVNLAEFREALIQSLPSGKDDPVVTGDLPFSPKAKRTFHAALVNAQAMREPSVSTRFLLLALLEDPDSAIRAALRQCGADADQLNRLLTEKPAQIEE